MDAEIKNIRDLAEIAGRRKWSFAVPAVAVFLLATLIAFAIPKKYQSTATILIEAQEIPNEYVKTNISSFADQRLQTINQQIMGTPRLLEMINRSNLYADLKDKMTMDEIVARMRKDIKFTTISADVLDPRSGRPAQATIAFSVSYRGRNPELVQKVASELSSLYVAENLKEREKQSAGTSQFLQAEMQNIQAELAAMEGKIAAFKQRNIEALPELSQVNMQAYEQVDRDIRLFNDQLRTLREKESYLESQVASVSPEVITNEKESLRQLKLKLTDLKSRFSDHYPDVIKTRTEIRELEQQMKTANLDISGSKPDNPAYITLASQLAGTRADKESLKRQIGELTRRRNNYQSRIMSSPRVEEGYKAMMVQRNNLQQKYDDLSKKAMEARVAHGMEKEQLGERFTIVDPARLPEKPSSPNVSAIMLMGLLLGVGCGVGLAAIREADDKTVRKADYLERMTGLPVLATIPEFVPVRDTGSSGPRKLRLNRLFVVGAMCLPVYSALILDALSRAALG